MGVVYKAHDQRLDRLVALKFLPIRLTTKEDEKARFIQEAKAAASLNHHNICTIYEINEFEGQSFIVMEYIEGQTLKEKIKLGPLNIKTIVEIASQIVEGLKKAHEKNIIHRDIKSANIMVTEEGQVKTVCCPKGDFSSRYANFT
jgi:serine/threonine protein kinase